MKTVDGGRWTVDVAGTRQELQLLRRPRKKLSFYMSLKPKMTSPKAGPKLTGSIQRHKCLQRSLFH